MRVVDDRSRGSDVDRYAERQIRWGDFERAQPGRLLGQADGRDHPRRPAGPLVVDLPLPVGELLAQIRLVQEATLLEERALHEADQILD